VLVRHELLLRLHPIMSTLFEQAKKDLDLPVFLISGLFIVAFVLFGALLPDQASEIFNAVQSGIVDTFGWFYIFGVTGFLLFILSLLFSRYGSIKLGPDDSEPDYSYLSWFAMLFSAGMGIGLVFYGVAEPIFHFGDPPLGEGGTQAAAQRSMELTFFHWGIHAWAVYIVVGLSLAYFGFRHGLPLTISSSLYPLIGDRIHGPLGKAVDIFAVFGTLFGVATSLGLGVMQINAGLDYLFGIPVGNMTQTVLITIITLMATVSVVLGLDKGIRRLSEANLTFALLLLIFVALAGPSIYLLNSFVSNLGGYAQSVIPLSFETFPYGADEGWQGGWTLFYWGWWIAWSPFVGMFIARISRGRTIREFITGVMLVPTALTFVWLTVFGNTAIHMDLVQGIGIADAVGTNLDTAFFVMLEELPLASITSLLTVTVIVLFFVTSSDSGSLVIDIITSGGDVKPKAYTRIFWAVSEGLVAIILLWAGGLGALQTAAIATGLPFAIIMVFICYGLYKGLRVDYRTENMEPEMIGSANDMAVSEPTEEPVSA